MCVTNYAPQHEDAGENGYIKPCILYFSTSWDWLSSRPDCFASGERAPQKAEEGQKWSGRRGQEKVLPLPGLQLRPLSRPANRQSLFRLRYPMDPMFNSSLLKITRCLS